jgi:hypothetical protein
VADVGFTLTTHTYEDSSTGKSTLGNHGFDPLDPSMLAIFVASGYSSFYLSALVLFIPSFRPSFPVKEEPMDSLPNVFVHSIVCEILRLVCPPSNATMSSSEIVSQYLTK